MPLPETVVIWICHNCGSYYASSSIGDLRKEWNFEKNTNRPTFQRSRCSTPACAAANIHREPMTLRTQL
jgi:hypothetical protein